MLLVRLVDLANETTDSSRIQRNSDPMGQWSWALLYGYPAYFEVRTEFYYKYTSGKPNLQYYKYKKHFHKMYEDVGMHYAKNHRNKE